MKPFRIFRPGKHRAACGTVVEFTEDDLKRAVAAYSPALYAAPLVIGHPKTEDRAYGWAESLTYEDGHVVVHPDKVNPEFSELVEQGAYRNRSASWYMPDHPSNPSPGNLYPKHIGFLGAVPPALKGLGDVAFAEGGQPVDFSAEEHPDKVVEFANAADDAWNLASMLSSTARMFRGLRDWMLAEKGAETADQLLPSWNIEDLERQALRQEEKARNTDPGLSYNEPANPTPKETTMTPEEIAKLQRERDEAQARVAQFTERETAIAAAERMATVAAIDASLDAHVKAGRLLPAHRKAVANFMADLADGTGTDVATIEFGEAAEGKPAPKLSPRAFMAAFLAGLPKAVDYNERGGNTTANGGAMTPKQLAAKATAKRDEIQQKEGRTISFTEATNLVLEEAGVSVESIGGGEEE